MEAEIKAMADIAASLKDLEPDAVRRVLKWANERFQLKPSPAAPACDSTNGSDGPPVNFTEFHQLFDAANPTTSVDKALVAGYWFQVVLKHEDLDSQALNKELKHLGHASTNVTRDLDHLIDRTPRLVIQVRKEGKHKQARCRYKLTREGIRAVERMLANGHSNGNGGH